MRARKETNGLGKNKSAAVDPGRLLALLWGTHTKPGRSGLTIRAVVRTAVDLADAEGIEAASMRRIAQRLGVATMAIYNHVPGKVELGALMVDAVYKQLYDETSKPARQSGGWREALRYIARRNYELHLAHPWLHGLRPARPILGPHETLKYEDELQPLDGVGLSDVEMDSVLSLVLAHADGIARTDLQLREEQLDSGQEDGEWWVQAAPLLEEVMDRNRFPVAVRVGTASGIAYQGVLNAEHALSFGLERILDGVRLLIQARHAADD